MMGRNTGASGAEVLMAPWLELQVLWRQMHCRLSHRQLWNWLFTGNNFCWRLFHALNHGILYACFIHLNALINKFHKCMNHKNVVFTAGACSWPQQCPAAASPMGKGQVSLENCFSLSLNLNFCTCVLFLLNWDQYLGFWKIYVETLELSPVFCKSLERLNKIWHTRQQLSKHVYNCWIRSSGGTYFAMCSVTNRKQIIVWEGFN